MASWLKNAVFYQIYPSSFCDANGDGFGDFAGISSKLEYVKSLGCNAIWLSPCFDSPFADGGYDVRDYFSTASRFGTIEELDALLAKAHSLGIKIILDLVPGHTSEEHPMFQESKQPQHNEFSDRYIWSDSAWNAPNEYRFISGRSQRDANYMVNFFSTQPALNYGFRNIKYPKWQQPYTGRHALATRRYIESVMDFWLARGFDGFRVDMADSLVKEDGTEKTATIEVWRDIISNVMPKYPEAVLISEWSNPALAVASAGFDSDFYLDHWGNGYNRMFRFEILGETCHSFFDPEGRGDVTAFIEEYLPKLAVSRESGNISFITCNHDTPRMSVFYDEQQLKLCYATIFSLPGVPFLYYGDEIAIDYQIYLASRECGYARTGSRTPMQWTTGKNFGFSTAPEDKLYLPTDGNPRHTVEAMEADPDSLLFAVRKIIAFRKANADFTGSDFEPLHAVKNGFPFVFKRGKFIVCVNPTKCEQSANLPKITASAAPVLHFGGKSAFAGGKLTMQPQSFAIFKAE